MEPSNPFGLFAQGGMMDAPDLVNYLNSNCSDDADSSGDGTSNTLEPAPCSETVEPVCTWCVDDSRDDFNELAYLRAVENGWISAPESSCDIDHILVQEEYVDNIKSAVFEREFMEAVVDVVNTYINDSVTMSDHYGVSLTIEFETATTTATSTTTASPDGSKATGFQGLVMVALLFAGSMC